MKITTTVLSAVAAVGIAVSVATAPTASAYSTVGKFGSYEKLYDAGGAIVTAWTVNNLKPSTDTIADYPLAGKLWEATATIKAVRGTVTPLIPNLNARGRRRPQLPSPLGRLYPAGISEACRPRPRSTGKIYFDVTGEAPPGSCTTTASRTCSSGKSEAPSRYRPAQAGLRQEPQNLADHLANPPALP